MSIGPGIPQTKRKQSEQIARATKEFLAKGGTIKQVDADSHVYSDEDVVDQHGAAALMGVSPLAVCKAGSHGVYLNQDFPFPIGKKDRKPQWRVSDIMDYIHGRFRHE